MTETSPYIRLVCEGVKTEPNYFNGYFKAKGFSQPILLNGWFCANYILHATLVTSFPRRKETFLDVHHFCAKAQK
jgi:hypothetical protein